jgi:hypothetical protein
MARYNKIIGDNIIDIIFHNKQAITSPNLIISIDSVV